MPSCSCLCCDWTMGGTSQRYFTPGSYPTAMPMPYYPPVSFDPPPDQFHRRGVMQPIRGSSSDGPTPTSLPPKAHPPPVVSPESLEPLRKPVVISPVILPQSQPQGPPVHILPSPRPSVRSPTQAFKAQRLRTRSPRTPTSREQSPRRRRPSPERSRRIQRIGDSDAGSYSPPSPHRREKASSRRPASGTDSSQSSRSGSPRKPVADEELQLNVSTTLARPTSAVHAGPNSLRAPLPPVRRAPDSDADSYSPPPPHRLERPLAHSRDTASSRHSASGTDSSQSSPSGPPRRPAADEELQLNVSTLARPTSSPQPNPNSPRASLPPIQGAVDSDADSYLPPSPHLREEMASLRDASGTDSSQSSRSGSPREPVADEEPKLNVSTLARPASSTQQI
ncbi:hypothetical protein BS47DRAFT_263298 [Hydnum rufescens UP504]|uniref:Uncharacterized protein n=1 Tax=Hydnum rufescens UP504 TaxID=1448309 RepID=A0A9P6B950_9AGAM|nr:hypothetical protein BS47DRAFT_263298 [Hydnum rufescens UP504]